MKYAISKTGIIHLISPLQGEHTLCGDAFDIDSEDDEKECAWVPIKNGPVDCPNCSLVIRACRGVQLRQYEKP